jgi:hypothetical protein
MVLSFSRDTFCCYVASMDTVTWWACHVRAFEHFGGVPGSIVYDRTKTVVRRHVAPGKAVPLQLEAVAFAGHYGFDIDVLAAYRPTGKGRVERMVDVTRDHVLAGRSFRTLQEADAAFMAWCDPRRRSSRPGTGVRPSMTRAAAALPAHPYVVTRSCAGCQGPAVLRGSHYGADGAGRAGRVRPTARSIGNCSDGGQEAASHARPRSGSWVVDESHWDGL